MGQKQAEECIVTLPTVEVSYSPLTLSAIFNAQQYYGFLWTTLPSFFFALYSLAWAAVPEAAASNGYQLEDVKSFCMPQPITRTTTYRSAMILRLRTQDLDISLEIFRFDIANAMIRDENTNALRFFRTQG